MAVLRGNDSARCAMLVVITNVVVMMVVVGNVVVQGIVFVLVVVTFVTQAWKATAMAGWQRTVSAVLSLIARADQAKRNIQIHIRMLPNTVARLNCSARSQSVRLTKPGRRAIGFNQKVSTNDSCVPHGAVVSTRRFPPCDC